MQFDIRKKRIPIWWFIAGGIILTLIITLFFGSNKPLDGYVDTNQQEIIDDGVAAPTLKENFKLYEDEATGFSFEIPETWKEIVKSGGKSFVHMESGTSVLVKVHDYAPKINHKDISYILKTYLEEMNTVELVSTNQISNTGIQIIYIKTINDVTYDVISNVLWSRDKIITVTATLDDSNYNHFKDVLDYIYSSIYWKTDAHIDEDYGIYYNEQGQYEIVLPLSWTFGESGSAAVLTDPENNVTFTIQSIETDESLNGFSQLDYTNFASNGRSNFILSKYSPGDNSIYAESTYVDTSTGVQMYLIHQLISTGTHEYIMTCEVPYSNVANVYDTVYECICSLRY